MRNVRLIIVLSSLLLTLAACDRSTVYSDFRTVPLTRWYADSALTYTFDIADTTATYQMQISIRHTQQYPYQNMWLFVSDSLRHDTIEFYLANRRGEWLGSGQNGLIEMPVLFEENRHFTAGTQTITIQHGMRDEPLQGVSDVGLIIKRNEKE